MFQHTLSQTRARPDATPFGKFPTLFSAFSCSLFALSTCEWTGRCYAVVLASHRLDHQFEELSRSATSYQQNKANGWAALPRRTRVGDVIQPRCRVTTGVYFACVLACLLASLRVKPSRLANSRCLGNLQRGFPLIQTVRIASQHSRPSLIIVTCKCFRRQ